MPTSTINIPEELKQLASTRAAATGHRSIDEYIGALIIADAGEPISMELESHLLSALKTPGRDMNATDWEEKRRKLSESTQRADR